MSTKQDDVAAFLKSCKGHISKNRFLFVRRLVNIQDIANLGLTIGGCKQEILGLTVEDYSSGPEADRDYPGDIWVFGKTILGHEVYIKLKIDDSGSYKQATCISFHIAIYPMSYPFK